MVKFKQYFLPLILMLSLVLSGSILPQSIERSAWEDDGPLPWFFVQGASYLGVDSTTHVLAIQTKISFDKLMFIKTDSVYEARYELSVTVFDGKKGQKGFRTIKKRAIARQFSQTNSNDIFDMVTLEFNLEPGKYRVEISLLDKDLQKTAHQNLKMIIPDYFSRPVTVSTCRFPEQRVNDNSSVSDCVFSVSGVLLKSRLYHPVSFWIYSIEGDKTVDINYEVLNAEGKVIRKAEETVDLSGLVTQHEYLLKTDFECGAYQLRIGTGKGRSKMRQTRNFKLHYKGMPVMSTSLNAAIEQLRYIAESEDRALFQDAVTEEEKIGLFREFWKIRDPSPQTPANELMEEYYRRVQFVNKKFGGFTKGWKTDRGRVFMILGAPDVVDRHPFDPNAYPYQIWHYNRVNRRFVFVDDSGFGEYYLTTPHYDILHGRN